MSLTICDFAGIEARGLAWVARENDLLDVFRNDGDVYKVQAGAIYNKSAEAVTKDERQLGKLAVLGLGYGMGSRKFVESCANWGVPIDLDFAQHVVDTYRRTNTRIKEFWSIGSKAIEVVQTGKPIETPTPRLCLEIWRDWLTIELPSGRRLYYYKPSIATNEEFNMPELAYTGVGVSGQAFRNRTYGGKLTENIVQAICADLLLAALRRARGAGYEILFHVHDEIVTRTRPGDPEALEDIMCAVPKWARGFPISAEGFTSERYRK